MNILDLEKLNPKISCYIFLSQNENPLRKCTWLCGWRMGCFQCPQFSQLFWKICSMTCDCSVSKNWENINSSPESFWALAWGCWQISEENQWQLTECRVTLYYVGEKAPQKVFFITSTSQLSSPKTSLGWGKKSSHWPSVRAARIRLCTVIEKKRWTFGWDSWPWGTINISQGRPRWVQLLLTCLLHPSMGTANDAAFIQRLEVLSLKVCHSKKSRWRVKYTKAFLEKHLYWQMVVYWKKWPICYSVVGGPLQQSEFIGNQISSSNMQIAHKHEIIQQ